MVYLQATRDDMDAREIESLSMISRGFEELRDVNPELAYNLILDVLSGIDEYVSASLTLSRALSDWVGTLPSNNTYRLHAGCSHTSALSAAAK